MSQQPFCHEESGTVRFWVEIEGQSVGASVRRETLHYVYRPTALGEDPMETFNAHTDDLHAAVRRRVASGSIEPVMLREFDLRVASV